ncbi:hypothetical protein [Halioxenophilus aromaticivorans]|uniref:Uncharacterized protein n=1 Tax=Halioxenophilus aromaticivorans TaxID=1306992 RepID=A0AAV3U280_9ALTE
MILQRLATAIRKQDWFTVVIETLIVVFGVYLGIQLGNFNAAQNAKAEEARIIERLTEDFQKQEEILIRRVEMAQGFLQTVDDLQRLIIAGEEPDDSKVVSDLLYRLTGTLTREAPPASYEELVSSGGFSQLSDAGLRAALSNYGQTNELWAYVEGQPLALIDPNSALAQSMWLSEDFMAVTETIGEQPRVVVFEYDWEKLKAARPALVGMAAYFITGRVRHERDLAAVRIVLSALEAVE